jgi:hypothetical protein
MNEMSRRRADKQAACDKIASAIDSGKLGDTVREHENLIMQYYEDVQDQAKRSFKAAIVMSYVGFAVLIATSVYALVSDGLHRFSAGTSVNSSLTVAGIGVVSGALIEFIAAVAFWLYSRGARQFSAFHICLERTHRYLLAYKMVGELGTIKDQTLRDLVCIMANAPMIAHQDADASEPSDKKIWPLVG